MLLNVTTKTTLRDLILDLDPTLINGLESRRITGSSGASYGLFISFVSGTVYFETLVGDALDLTVHGQRLHTLETVTVDVKKLDTIWFDGTGSFLVSFV